MNDQFNHFTFTSSFTYGSYSLAIRSDVCLRLEPGFVRLCFRLVLRERVPCFVSIFLTRSCWHIAWIQDYQRRSIQLEGSHDICLLTLFSLMLHSNRRVRSFREHLRTKSYAVYSMLLFSSASRRVLTKTYNQRENMLHVNKRTPTTYRISSLCVGGSAQGKSISLSTLKSSNSL